MALFKNPVINGIKKCNICGQSKSVDEYYIYKGHPRGHCKACNYEMVKSSRSKLTTEQKSQYWQKLWAKPEYRISKYKSTKKRAIEIKKKCINYLGGACLMCGYNKCIEALEFHHKDQSTKDPTLTNGRGINKRKCFETLKEELNKCVLLCANCHREIHYEQRHQNISSV